MKRFWKDVAVVEDGIRLDGRPVRTPARAELKLPTAALAEAVAGEWRAQAESIIAELDASAAERMLRMQKSGSRL